MKDPASKFKVTSEMVSSIQTQWDKHLEYYHLQPDLMDNLQSNHIDLYLSVGDKIPYNSPTGTWQSHVYPFSTNESLRKKFLKFDT